MSGRFLSCPEQGACRVGRSAEARHTSEENIGKARRPEREEMGPDRDRAADSLRPCFGAVCHALGQFLLQHYIGKAKPAPRLQHAVDLAEQGLFLR